MRWEVYMLTSLIEVYLKKKGGGGMDMQFLKAE